MEGFVGDSFDDCPRSVEGSFEWTNKEITSFDFWAPQQPNNLKNEDCVHTLGAEDGYTWNDVSCDKCFNYTHSMKKEIYGKLKLRKSA